MSRLRGMRVLVTGATGLVGGFVVEELLRRGAMVIAVVRDEVKHAHFHTAGLADKCVVTYGQLEDDRLLGRVVNEYQIQGIFHLAAQTQVRVASESPVPTFRSNIEGTWNVLEAARQHPSHMRFVVVASSDKAYGEPLTKQYDESHPLNAVYPYDVSKACADMVAKSYAVTYGMPICTTRCGNFFGPGDLNWDRIIPHTVSQFLAGERPVLRSSGKLVRDYFFVKDGACAYLFLAEKILELGSGLFGEAFNFSYGTQHSVLELVAIIAKLMGCEHLPPKILDEAKHEINYQSLAAKKAETMLGWRPVFNLEEGLKQTIQWQKDRR